MKIFETHAHLDFAAFDDDQPQVIERARAAGVEFIVNVAIDPATAAGTLELIDAYAGIYGAVGIHPHRAGAYVGDLERAIGELRRLARHEAVVAIGEMGLDFYRDDRPQPDDQRRVFLAQLELAAELNLPVIIHCRDAYPETLACLAERPVDRVVVHCFSGNDEDAATCAERGYYIGIGGVLTFPNAHSLRRIAAAYPRDKVVLETDCPFLAPQPQRGRRNEPAYLTSVVQALAAEWGVSAEQAAAVTFTNACRLFGLE